MSSHNPKPVMFPPEGVKTGSLGRVPNPNGLVFAVGDNQVLTRVKDDAADVVVMAATRVNLPSLK